jgi:starch synthase
MKILFAASEMTPFAATGGLGDVAGSLSHAIAGRGAEVVRVMPMYRQVIEGGFQPVDTGVRLDIPLGLRTQRAEIWRLDAEGVATYFIRRDEYFDRAYLYNLPTRDYDDNFERFVFFQKAVVGLVDALKIHPDIVHCSDWQTGLLPLFLRHGIRGTGRTRTEKTVFTIHNLAYQGLFSANEYTHTNLPFSTFTVDTMEFYGNINLLKCGITMSDLVTAVSVSYLREIQNPDRGFGLHGVVAAAAHKLVGIVNGIDTREWNPDEDPRIARTYSASNPEGKGACKRQLLAELSLDPDPKKPLIGMIARLVDQKGLDLLEEAMPEIMERPVSFVLLGHGLQKYEELAQSWALRWPGRCACRIDFDRDLAHRIEAGSDLYLMPSRSEPCGLNQLYSLRYGTLPIVHGVGGLEDTIEDLEEKGDEGWGLKFREYTVDALLAKLDVALRLYDQPKAWSAVQNRAMLKDFSWDHSAGEYISVYERLLKSQP